MESDPPSLPSTQTTTVHITTTAETPLVSISVPNGPMKPSNSSPSSPQSASASVSGSGGQHTFYKPRATSTASARRSRAESLTNSLNNIGGGAVANYPPSVTTISRPHSFSRSRPPSVTYTTPAVPITPSVSASLTHTGGILPPASFFHPKQAQEFRPPPLNANNVYAPPRASAWSGFAHSHSGNTRPSSGISSASSSGGGTMNPNFPLVSSTSSHAREHGLIMLPLSHIHSTHSDGSNSGLDISSYSDSSQRRRSGHGGVTRVKPSREALLPIGEKDAFSGNGSGKSQHTGVRGSIEKIFRRTTTSSERERTEAALANKESGVHRPAMDDHARAASSLSVRLRRANSTAEPPTRPEPPVVVDPVAVTAQQPTTAATDISHGEAPPHPFEGVALDGQRFTYGPERNWQNFPSRNTFFLNGRLLTGGDSPLAFIFSVSVVLAIGGVWFGTTAVWWWKHESPAVAAVGVYMCLLTIASMFATAMRDPGILPRNLDIDPPYPSTPPVDGGPRLPLPRDLRVRSGAVRVKYCTTCKTYRPPRSSHCKLCDNCVEGCDHHCPWVNNCIGRRNYTSFFTFLFFANSTLLLVIITSALHIWLLIHRHFVTNFADALKHGQGSAAAFVMSILVLGPVTALFSYHVRLMLLNVTTIEQVRNQAHRSIVPGPLPANPFTLKRWYRNLGHLMCRPVIFSYIEANEPIKHDQRLPNPGHDRTARLASEGFGSDAFDHHQVTTDSHRDSMWKEDLTELEMQHVGHGRVANVDSSGMVNRSTWDHD